MAVALRSVSSYNPGSGGYDAGTRVVSPPAGATDGDLLVAVLMVAKEGTTAPTSTGWSLAGTIAPAATMGVARTGANGSSAVLWKPGAAADGSYSFVTPATATITIGAYTGADLTSPFAVLPQWAAGSSTSIVAPSVAVPAGGALVTAHAELVGSAITFSTPTGESVLASPLRAGNYLSSAAFTQLFATAAASGTKTSTASAAPTGNTESMALAISPAPESSGQFFAFFGVR